MFLIIVPVQDLLRLVCLVCIMLLKANKKKWKSGVLGKIIVRCHKVNDLVYWLLVNVGTLIASYARVCIAPSKVNVFAIWSNFGNFDKYFLETACA